MKKSEAAQWLESISEAVSGLRHIFPLELSFDSTAGKSELQPLRARPVLKGLVVFSSYVLAGLFVLVLHFNIGWMLSVPLTIAILWVFATLRDLPPAPIEVDVKFWSDGSLRIKTEGASISLDDVGPIWEQDGLVFALAHDYEEKLESGGKYSASVLPALRARASKLGVERWNPSDIHDPHKNLVPGKWEGRAKMEAVMRSMYGPLLEKLADDAIPVPILLGRLLDADDTESSSQNRQSLAASCFIGFIHLKEKMLQPAADGQKTEPK